jgi:hypothetical protein
MRNRDKEAQKWTREFGRHLTREEFLEWQRKARAFEGDEIPNLGRLTAGQVRRLGGDPLFIVPFVAKQELCSERAMEDLVEWLNGDTTRYESVNQRWSSFVNRIRSLADLHYELFEASRKTKHKEPAMLLRVMHAWAAGRLDRVKRCLNCDIFFIPDKKTDVFHTKECRNEFYAVEHQSDEYKDRKAAEACERRKKTKKRHFKEDVRHMLAKRLTGNDKKLEEEVLARKYRVKLSKVRELVFQLSSPNLSKQPS